MILVPEVRKFIDFYSKLYYYRNKLAHGDDFVPTSSEVDSLLKRTYEFNSFLNDEVIPNLEQAHTPKEKYIMELENAKWLMDYLENIPGPFTEPAPRIHAQFRSEIKEFEDRMKRFEIDIEFLNESRIELRQFTIKVESEIKETEEAIKWEIGMIDAESRFGR